MLHATPLWQAFEAADELAVYGAMPYAEALQRFERLWRLARTLRPDIGTDWRDDLVAARAVARAVNGLPQPEHVTYLL